MFPGISNAGELHAHSHVPEQSMLEQADSTCPSRQGTSLNYLNKL